MAVLSASYDVESGVKTTLKNTISPTTTSGIQLNYALTVTSGVLLFDPDTDREEFISFGGNTVSGGISTLSDVTRNLTKTLNDFSGTGTGFQHNGSSCVVELTNYHALYNKKANTDRANSWLADQTMASTKKWFFFDSGAYVFSDGVDLYLKSQSQAQVSLTVLAGAAGVNDKVKVSINDTTQGYLSSKIVAGNGLVASIGSPAGNETHIHDIDLSTDPGLEFSGGQLRVKVKAAGGILRDSNGLSIDTSATLTWTGVLDFTSATVTGLVSVGLVDSITLGETVTTNQGIAINGDERAYLAQGDVLNDTYLFIGTAREGGNIAESKRINTVGPVVTIANLAANKGRFWTGQTQGVSTGSVAVYGVNQESQTFTPAAGEKRIDKIVLNLVKTGSPTGSYTLDIKATDGSGHPTGAVLATVAVASSSLSSGDNTFDGFNLSGVTPLTKYAWILRNSAADVANNVAVSVQNTDVLAGGNREDSVDSGASWSTISGQDFRFTVYYRAVAGSDVYIHDTEGTLTLDPSTDSTRYQRIGIAISDTKMILERGERSIYATYTWSASSSDINVDTEITLGFRPRAVFAIADIGAGNSVGFWHPGLSGGMYWGMNTTSTNHTQMEGPGYIAGGRSSGGAVNDSTQLKVQAVSSDTITIRREMNDDTADAPGGTVHLIIIG